MKPITPAVLALLLAGSAGLSGLVPAYADDPAPTPPPAASAPAAAQPEAPAVPPPAVNPDTHAPQPSVPPPAVNPDAQAPQGGAQPSVPPPAVNPNTHAPQGSAQPNRTPGPQGGGAGGNPFAFRFGGPMGGFGGGLGTSVLRLACGDRGAEALEIAFVRIQYEVKPTGPQQQLFDTLKQAAIADQKNYADACRAAVTGLRGGQGQSQPSVLDRFAARLALETARVNALNDILPKFRAFFDSLTDQQKAQFQPRRAVFSRNGMGHMGPGMGAGPNGMMGRGNMGRGMGPGGMGPGGMGPGGMGHGNMGHGNMPGFQGRPGWQGGANPSGGMQRPQAMPAPDDQPGVSQPGDDQPDSDQPDDSQPDTATPADPATNGSTPA